MTSNQDLYYQFCDRIFQSVNGEENLTITLEGERTNYIRFNESKVRQSGFVNTSQIDVTLQSQSRTFKTTLPFTECLETNVQSCELALKRMRSEIPDLPEDPYFVPPSSTAKSENLYEGKIPFGEEAIKELLPVFPENCLTGIYSAGKIFRGSANSLGSRHWFADSNFHLDYSLMSPDERMVKGHFAGSEWSPEDYRMNMSQSCRQLNLLSRPELKVEPGKYRVYFSPDSTAELMGLLSWGGLSESALQQGRSIYGKMRDQGAKLSPLFTLKQDFNQVRSPVFNEVGEVAPETLSLIENGELRNVLVNSRSAKEYGVESNHANDHEFFRAPVIAPGKLSEQDILSKLDTGLYLSNLHYLNWSDWQGGRLTGMTRFACFWVENGEIVSPIENIRFDDSIYSFLGEKLEAVTNEQFYRPDGYNYEGRRPGGSVSPGLLISEFEFTL